MTVGWETTHGLSVYTNSAQKYSFFFCQVGTHTNSPTHITTSKRSLTHTWIKELHYLIKCQLLREKHAHANTSKLNVMSALHLCDYKVYEMKFAVISTTIMAHNCIILITSVHKTPETFSIS